MTARNVASNLIPLSVWKEKDSIDRKEADALVMILKTRGCSWAKRSGCTMCGYNRIVYPDVTSSDLKEQVEHAMKSYNDEPYVKIFTSGSYLDPWEIPAETQVEMSRVIGEKAPMARLLIESRPEFIDPDGLERISHNVDALEIAVGLETSSDEIRAVHIKKGFTWSDYVKGGRIICDAGCLLKSYLLMKPPFLGEANAIQDCITSIMRVSEVFPGSRISVNPMNIQSQTPVEDLFRKGLYRPPWLWSLLEVLDRGYEYADGNHIMSSPTAGGRKRGAHNCGECDEGILGAITSFSIDNDPSKLKHHDHYCKEEWKEHLIGSVSHPIDGVLGD
ncbi:MAG: archaeosine biosynthesis radical SAM protein RaSEA [Candidatus Thermoplasmatota archaeon]|nr:archaeosine biosynthesis radical SAM protein RaSEA [Candidatus Thermoplasmatota archaeon]